MLKIIPAVKQLVSMAVAEDLNHGDVTSFSLPEPSRKIQAKIVLEEDGIIAGLDILELIFSELGISVDIQLNTRDGCYEKAVKDIVVLNGPAYGLLISERIILNFLTRMSGIATKAAKLVSLLEGTKCRLLDTRKTTPGWRYLDKYATHMAGVVNHRFGLDSGIMIKDNHLLIYNSIEDAVTRIRKNCGPLIKIALEVERKSQVVEALKHQVEHLLLDNMSTGELHEMVELIDGRARTEASGGITAVNLTEYAQTGVDYISMGSLTSEVKFLKMKLEF